MSDTFILAVIFNESTLEIAASYLLNAASCFERRKPSLLPLPPLLRQLGRDRCECLV